MSQGDPQGDGRLDIGSVSALSAGAKGWVAPERTPTTHAKLRLTPRPGEHLLKPLRQLIESVNDTLKGQLDLEFHGGPSIDGVGARVAQRLLALTAAI